VYPPIHPHGRIRMIPHLNKIIIGVVVVLAVAVTVVYANYEMDQLDHSIAKELSEKAGVERATIKKTLPTPNVGAIVK
jgi:hypothetical protein